MERLNLLTYCSSEVLAKTCPSPGNAPDLRESEAGFLPRPCESLTRWMHRLESAFGKTYAAHCPATKEQISPPSSRKWGSGGVGSLTEFLTFNGSECHNDAAASSLSDILEAGEVPQKYFLSAKACAGILRRAEKRGKALPVQLEEALTAVASARP